MSHFVCRRCSPKDLERSMKFSSNSMRLLIGEVYVQSSCLSRGNLEISQTRTQWVSLGIISIHLYGCQPDPHIFLNPPRLRRRIDLFRSRSQRKRRVNNNKKWGNLKIFKRCRRRPQTKKEKINGNNEEGGSYQWNKEERRPICVIFQAKACWA